MDTCRTARGKLLKGALNSAQSRRRCWFGVGERKEEWMEVRDGRLRSSWDYFLWKRQLRVPYPDIKSNLLPPLIIYRADYFRRESRVSWFIFLNLHKLLYLSYLKRYRKNVQMNFYQFWNIQTNEDVFFLVCLQGVELRIKSEQAVLSSDSLFFGTSKNI